MKRIGICLMIVLATLWMGSAAGSEAPGAAQEPSTGAPPAAPVSPGESSVKAKEPFDSVLVIPKGPQWIGAPVMPDGTKISEMGGRYVYEINMPYAQVLAWYQEALKAYPDTRYRDWKQEMYIEDQGASRWHAIKISKTGGSKTNVTIQKDNWTWIIATLVIRFVGVFVVLLVLWLGLNISGAILKRMIQPGQQKPAAAGA